jgi:hypothetical protein
MDALVRVELNFNGMVTGKVPQLCLQGLLSLGHITDLVVIFGVDDYLHDSYSSLGSSFQGMVS